MLGGAWLYATQYDPNLFIPGFDSNQWHVSKRWEEDAWLLGSRTVASPHIWMGRKLDG